MMLQARRAEAKVVIIRSISSRESEEMSGGNRFVKDRSALETRCTKSSRPWDPSHKNGNWTLKLCVRAAHSFHPPFFSISDVQNSCNCLALVDLFYPDFVTKISCQI